MKYYNARWYNADLGKFISEDPAGQGWNWYGYGANNPLLYTDPTGLDIYDFMDAIKSGSLNSAERGHTYSDYIDQKHDTASNVKVPKLSNNKSEEKSAASTAINQAGKYADTSSAAVGTSAKAQNNSNPVSETTKTLTEAGETIERASKVLMAADIANNTIEETKKNGIDAGFSAGVKTAAHDGIVVFAGIIAGTLTADPLVGFGVATLVDNGLDLYEDSQESKKESNEN